MNTIRPLITAVGLIIIWQLIVLVTGVEHFILPSPLNVANALATHFEIIFGHTWITLIEILLGLTFGIILGTISAVLIGYFAPARQWLMPVLVISQAVPVFALAPILVLWMGYGITSKVAMATLIIYFPVTAALFDGLRRTDPGYLELAQTMGATRWAILRHIRIPNALPSFASGVRVATAVAPIGAIVGEWVGSSRGLGFLMLHANARLQIDVMFAALFVLAVMALLIYFSIDAALKKMIRWQPETQPSND